MDKEGDILIVDDDEGHRVLLSEKVKDLGFSPDTASDGFEAMAKMKTGFDLVLLDAQMPGKDGFEVAGEIREEKEYDDVTIVMVTGHDSQKDKKRAGEIGIEGFIGKPVEFDDLKSIVCKLLESEGETEEFESIGSETPRGKKTAEEMDSYIQDLTLAKREAYLAQIETLERLAVASGYRDEDTGAHVRRMAELSAMIGEKLNLSPAQVEILQYSGQLHDVGKIATPDAILLKEGKLNDEEWEIMKKHTTRGSEILEGSSSKFLKAGQEISLTHQEKWDGSGYPRGLEGQEIPLNGRICAIADVYDALTSDRPYRDAFSTEKALEIIKEGRGQHFDPEVVDIFLENIDEVRKIEDKYREEEKG